MNSFKDVRTENGSSQGRNLALTVLYVPYSLDSGVDLDGCASTSFSLSLSLSLACSLSLSLSPSLSLTHTHSLTISLSRSLSRSLSLSHTHTHSLWTWTREKGRTSARTALIPPTCQVPSQVSTHKTVKARFWLCLEPFFNGSSHFFLSHFEGFGSKPRCSE